MVSGNTHPFIYKENKTKEKRKNKILILIQPAGPTFLSTRWHASNSMYIPPHPLLSSLFLTFNCLLLLFSLSFLLLLGLRINRLCDLERWKLECIRLRCCSELIPFSQLLEGCLHHHLYGYVITSSSFICIYIYFFFFFLLIVLNRYDVPTRNMQYREFIQVTPSIQPLIFFF